MTADRFARLAAFSIATATPSRRSAPPGLWVAIAGFGAVCFLAGLVAGHWITGG